ncbi:MAG TPA: hypothetical protein VE263_22590 [Candidatus Angelobacter sp.]|nr:hypothetical protein [Candidatus Angelobacter sp.]
MAEARRYFRKVFRIVLWAQLFATLPYATTAADNDPFAKIPAEQRQPLKSRLDDYLKLQRGQDWSKLYDLVSDTGRGGVSREKFVAAMKRGHGRDFANEPDLLEFVPKRTESGLPDGFDIYGCAQATREGQSYRGVAVTHVIFEHNNWFFTGWTFEDISDHLCKALEGPSWQPGNRMKWTMPMEELRSIAGQPMHVDATRKP